MFKNALWEKRIQCCWPGDKNSRKRRTYYNLKAYPYKNIVIGVPLYGCSGWLVNAELFLF